MSISGFKKNLKGVNGGSDFDEDMLDEIYNAIKYVTRVLTYFIIIFL